MRDKHRFRRFGRSAVQRADEDYDDDGDGEKNYRADERNRTAQNSFFDSDFVAVAARAEPEVKVNLVHRN